MEGFQIFPEKINACVSNQDYIKVRLEVTGHSNYNLPVFLLNSGLPTDVLNPPHTNLCRKSLSLRKTKANRVDARTIAAMLLSDLVLKLYADTALPHRGAKVTHKIRI